jgi:hypothetical protein
MNYEFRGMLEEAVTANFKALSWHLQNLENLPGKPIPAQDLNIF